MPSKDRKLLVLIDSHAVMHRGYHAMPNFKTSRGEPTGALYGLSLMLLSVMKDIRPDYIAAAFDLPEPTFRHEMTEDYKAGRAEIDHDLIHQLDKSYEVYKAFGVPTYEAAGFEADDVLGTIVEQVTGDKEFEDVDVVIASGDMDTMSLVNGKRVQVYTLRKGLSDTIMYDAGAVKERYGFPPDLVTSYKALRGDPSDNIIGVKGIGDKIATELVAKVGDLGAIYKLVKGKGGKEKLIELGFKERVVNLLLENEDEARFSLELATIRRDAPIDFKLPAKTWQESIEREEAGRLFDELEFRSLHARLDGLNGGAEADEEEEVEIDEQVLEEAKIAYWILDANRTNPSLDEIMRFAKAKTLSEAKDKLFKEVEAQELGKVLHEIELPLLPVMQAASARGVKVDTKALERISKDYHRRLDELEKKIYKLAGREFNINSPKQLGEVLFGEDGLGLKPRKKTSTGQPSTNATVLEAMKDDHEIVALLLDYREVGKLLSTYVDPIPEMLDGSSRLHTKYVLTGAATGRMSSQDPNLQNIPIRSELGRAIRDVFVADKGHKLVAFDYSQVDLRSAAALSKDKKLVKFFKSGGDIHDMVANEMGVERRHAKVINFGILYGMGTTALSKNLGVPRKEAEAFNDKYFGIFNELHEYMEGIKNGVHKKGYTETLFGRRRYYPDINAGPEYIQKAAERAAINAPMQGTSADIIKIGTVRVNEYLKSENLLDKVHLILQVHDELIYEIDESVVETVSPKIQEILQDVMKGAAVPFPVKVSVGAHWGEL